MKIVKTKAKNAPRSPEPSSSLELYVNTVYARFMYDHGDWGEWVIVRENLVVRDTDILKEFGCGVVE